MKKQHQEATNHHLYNVRVRTSFILLLDLEIHLNFVCDKPQKNSLENYIDIVV